MIRWIFFLLIFAASPAFAEDEIGAATNEAKALSSKSAAMKLDIDNLQARLVEASRSERETNTKLRELITKIRQLEKEQSQVNGELKARRQTLAELLVALSRLSRLPPEIGLLRQEKSKDAVLSSILLNSSLPEIRKDAERLSASLNELDRVQTDLEKQRTSLASARKDQERERADIEGLLAARKEKLQLTTQEQAEINARLEKLRRESQNMDELINKVATAPASKLGRPPKAPPVLALRGGYLQPVSGDLGQKFGDRDEAGVISKGLEFKAEGGDRIVSPAKGRVMFAGPFRGYGQIVIIEHEGDMHSLIGGFGRIDVTVGQKVAQGEPLGLVDGAPATRHDVYFELRSEGEPIDPKPRPR